MNDEQWRGRARRALHAYFQKNSAPRVILSTILIVTGGAALALSVFLLHCGIVRMWIRYPAAVLGGYLVFLGLIRLWVQFEKSRFNAESSEISEALARRQREFESTWRGGRAQRGSWLDWLDVPNVLDFDEGCLVVLVIGAVIGIVAVLVTMISTAPALAAEVFIDAFIVSALYRRLGKAARESWLGTAVKKTWWRALLVAALLSAIGGCLEYFAPNTHSIGPALNKIFNVG